MTDGGNSIEISHEPNGVMIAIKGDGRGVTVIIPPGTAQRIAGAILHAIYYEEDGTPCEA